MTNNGNTRTDRTAADQAMINGTEKFLATLPNLLVGGKTMTPADIVQVFKDRIGTAAAAILAEGARTAAVKADRDERASTAAFVQAFRRIVLGMYQNAPDTLAIFGLEAPKPRKTTVAAQATAVARNKATRLARGTVGPKKKLEIKGTVPAEGGGAPAPEAPATTPATTAPVTAPANAPAPGPAAKPAV